MKGKSGKALSNKETQGAGFYREKHGLKSIVVHVPPGTYKVIKKKADIEYRSLQKMVRKILVDYADHLTNAGEPSKRPPNQ